MLSFFLLFFFFIITIFFLDWTAIVICLCWVVVGSTAHIIGRTSRIVGWRGRDIHRTRVINRLRRTSLAITTVSRVNWISGRSSSLVSLGSCSIGRRCWWIRRTEVVIVGSSRWVGWTVAWIYILLIMKNWIDLTLTSGWIASWMTALLLLGRTVWWALLGNTCRVDWAATNMAGVVTCWIISSRVNICWAVSRHASRRVDWTLVVATARTLVRSMVVNLIYGWLEWLVDGRLIVLVARRRHPISIWTIRVRTAIAWWLHHVRSRWEATLIVGSICDTVLWSRSIVLVVTWCHPYLWSHHEAPVYLKLVYNWSVSSFKDILVMLSLGMLLQHKGVNYQVKAACSKWSQLSHDNVFSYSFEGVTLCKNCCIQQNFHSFLKWTFS